MTEDDELAAKLQELIRESIVWGDRYPIDCLLTDVFRRWGLPVDDPRQRVIRPGEAARYLGLSEKTLWWYRRHRSGPAYVRLGKVALGYRVSDLDAWILARRVIAAESPRSRGRPPKQT